MVQARQISVFSAAALSGRYLPGGSLALLAAENMITRFESADGQPGWVFSIQPNNREINPVRDLYAHAFVLFGLAWVLRLEKRETFIDAVERTIEFLDQYMSDPVNGGFWDSCPRTDGFRRQNPHMHLFEAFIALYETTGDRRFLNRGRELRDLALNRFLVAEGGALRELFYSDWSVAPAAGQGHVEPGHLFEWSWLLWQYQNASGEDQSDPIMRMMKMAVINGLDGPSGRIVDQISERGEVIEKSSRSWPHAEALKAMTSIPAFLGGGDAAIAIAILSRLMSLYCPTKLRGGWADQLDENDQPVRPNIPASTLYHLYFGVTAIEKFARSN